MSKRAESTKSPLSDHADSLSEESLGRRMLKNTAALLVGRNLNAFGRLVIAMLIVRFLGTSVYGEYALIVVWLTIAEWILDFGTTAVFVREANKAPDRRRPLLRIFLALKLIQAPVAVLLLAIGLVGMQYPPRVVTAGLLAGVSLLFVSGVVFTRASFKASLVMEREMLAEFFSVLTMLGLLLLLPRSGLGLMGLMGAYVVSRAVFMVGCLTLSRDLIELSVKNVRPTDLKWAVGSSFAIGLIGFVVVIYNATDLLILSRIASLEDVALYSAAQRFTIPLMMAMNSVSVSLYPALALLDSPERFRKTCQQGINATLLLSGFALVCLWSGAEFLMGLLGEDFVFGADVLRVLALVSVVKAVSMVIGPVLFLVKAQNLALGYMCVAWVAKAGILVAVTPHFGYMGAAAGALAVETLFLTPVTLYAVYRRTGLKARAFDALRIIGIVIAVILIIRAILPGGGPLGMAVAGMIYVLLVVSFGAIRIADVRALLDRDDA